MSAAKLARFKWKGKEHYLGLNATALLTSKSKYFLHCRIKEAAKLGIMGYDAQMQYAVEQNTSDRIIEAAQNRKKASKVKGKVPQTPLNSFLYGRLS